MAELLLIVTPTPKYEQGDILVPFSQRRIRDVHAQHICAPKLAARKPGGLLREETLTREYLESTHQYRFERVSRLVVTRTNLFTGEVEVFGAIPNARGEAMDVPLTVARKRAALMNPENPYPMFGEDGAEVWYGGTIRVDHPQLDKVWRKIEEKSPLREAQHRLFPLSPHEKRRFLGISVTDFSEEEAGRLSGGWERVTESTFGSMNDGSGKVHLVEEQVRIRARSHYVDFRPLFARRMRSILNPAEEVDLRLEQTFPLQNIVKVKGPL